MTINVVFVVLLATSDGSGACSWLSPMCDLTYSFLRLDAVDVWFWVNCLPLLTLRRTRAPRTKKTEKYDDDDPEAYKDMPVPDTVELLCLFLWHLKPPTLRLNCILESQFTYFHWTNHQVHIVVISVMANCAYSVCPFSVTYTFWTVPSFWSPFFFLFLFTRNLYSTWRIRSTSSTMRKSQWVSHLQLHTLW